MLLLTTPVFAAKPAVNSCTTIQSGTLVDSVGSTISLGYDQWGYNYQANIFNGKYCDAYRGASWCEQFKDVDLQMKWNNAWLSNQSCDNNLILDRHFGLPNYIGSGAWLTNHAKGTYTSKDKGHWEVSGEHVISFVLGGTWNHDIFLTYTNGVLTGNGGYPVGGPYSYEWNITSGSISGDTFAFDAVYTGGPDATGTIMHVSGTIAIDGSISGSWDDNYLGGYRTGTWSMPIGSAIKIMDTCEVSDFVKIVAVPVTAELDPLVTGHYGEGMWYTNDGKEIGPSIWGEFAVIQEDAIDSCGEYQVIDYMSPLKKGLGNWSK